jgi:hypothetical protein
MRNLLAEETSMSKSLVVIVLIGFVIVPILAGCASETTDQHPYTLAPASSLPLFARNMGTDVETAYRFAINNAHELEKYPCYCGCGAMGHTSNRACYIQDPDGSNMTKFDAHAVGCQICIDITHDVMKGLDAGKSSREIRDYIDAAYSQYGVSMDTPLPE